MTAPRLFDRRLGSLLVVVAIVAGAAFLALDSLAQWRAAEADLDAFEQRVLLLEERAAELARTPAIQSNGSAVDRRLLVFGETPGLVAAELQRTVGFIADRTGATLRSVDIAEFETVPEVVGSDGETLQRVRLNAEFEVGEQSLPDFLYNIEADFPVLVVDAITLRGTRRVADAASEMWAPADQQLNLRMTISAFWTGGGE